jgi:hypothetical protein
MRRLLPVLFVFAVLAGCDSGDDPAPFTPNALLPDDALYAWSFESRAVESDSLLFGESDEIRVRTVSRNASVPGYQGLIELESRYDRANQRVWYELTDERLRAVAYTSTAFTPPASPRVAAGAPDVFGLPRIVADLVAQHRPLRSGGERDSVTVRDDPRVVYELPLEVGASWVSFTDPFGSARAVVGRETVTVEAGTFDCLVIRTEIDVVDEDERFEWLDYVSAERGLVLRKTEWLGEYRGPENLPTGAFFRTVERLELIAGG